MIALKSSLQERKLMVSLLIVESVSINVLKSLVQRNSSDVKLKQWGI